MKNLIIFAFALLLGLECFSQVEAIFPKRDSPSKEKLKELAFTADAKGYAFRNSFIENTNVGLKDTTYKASVTRLDEFFDHLYLEEVYLQESGYKNSGWNPVTQKMVPSIGHKWTGFVWVFRIGTFAIPIIKGDCGNILSVPVIRIQKPKQNNVNVNNNVKVVYDTVDVNNSNNQQPNYSGNNSFTVRTGGTFISDRQMYYQPQPYYGGSSFVVRTGATFYPDYGGNYGYGYNYGGHSYHHGGHHKKSYGGSSHKTNNSNHHSSGGNYYGHRK